MLAFAPDRCHRGSSLSRLLAVLGGAAVALSTLVPRASHGAVVEFVLDGGTTSLSASTNREKPVAAFALPTQGADVKDAIDEFQRLVEHQAWEKAFKSLEGIAAKSATGFVERDDGVLLPSRLLVRSLLANLPPAGKNAYRTFFDPQAAALWEKAAGKAEAENLSAIVGNHLISSVGDQAADRLGDLYFEQGEFDQAVVAWRSILAYCPDTKLSKPLVSIKVATALARAGRWNEFAEVQRAVGERYAGETIDLGGRRSTAADEIARLAAGREDPDAVTKTRARADFALPSGDEPLWQFRYQPKPDQTGTANNPFQLMDVWGRNRGNDFLIPAAVDDARIYINLFGVEMAFDLATGKLVWRNGRLHQLQLQNGRQGVMPERYRMLAAGDRLWSVTRDPQQVNQNPPLFALVARERATGKELWSSRRALSNWSILGAPMLVGNQVYVGAGKSNQGRELSMLVLDAKDGKLLKTIALGNHAVDQNQVYFERIAEPTFFIHRDRLYVDTHAGALVSVQPVAGTIDWGVLYDSPAAQAGYNYYEYSPPQLSVSRAIYAGGLLFSKGMRSTRLLGIQPDGPQLVWNRPIARSATLIGADEERIYLGGEELAAYSLKTQELLWATQLPRTAAWSEPVITAGRIYQFTSRGVCEVEKKTGRLVKIFRGVDLDAFGGTMFVTPTALITVSNLAITAYALPSEGEPPAN